MAMWEEAGVRQQLTLVLFSGVHNLYKLKERMEITSTFVFFFLSPDVGGRGNVNILYIFCTCKQ